MNIIMCKLKPNQIIIFICTASWFTFCKVNTNSSTVFSASQDARLAKWLKHSTVNQKFHGCDVS